MLAGVRGACWHKCTTALPTGAAPIQNTSAYAAARPQALFYDYMTALATHVNAFTGLAYRDDPAVLGWELMEGAADPQSRGEDLQVRGAVEVAGLWASRVHVHGLASAHTNIHAQSQAHTLLHTHPRRRLPPPCPCCLRRTRAAVDPRGRQLPAQHGQQPPGHAGRRRHVWAQQPAPHAPQPAAGARGCRRAWGKHWCILAAARGVRWRA